MKPFLLAPLCFLLAACAAPIAKKLSTPTLEPVKQQSVVVVSRWVLSWHLCQSVGWCPLDASPIDLTHLPLDARYVVPNKNDITRLLAFYIKRREFTHFHEDSWDCDDIAREFLHYSRVWSFHQYGHAPVAVAVGMAFVKIDGDISDLFPGNHRIMRGLHVTNVILRDDGQWFFYEPQTGAMSKVESMLFEGSITIERIEL